MMYGATMISCFICYKTSDEAPPFGVSVDFATGLILCRDCNGKARAEYDSLFGGKGNGLATWLRALAIVIDNKDGG